jgi:hypothetical protein
MKQINRVIKYLIPTFGVTMAAPPYGATASPKADNHIATMSARRMTIHTISSLILLVALTAHAASTQEHTYEAAYDRVWTACVQVASQKYAVTSSDKASGILTMQTGQFWFRPSTDTQLGVTLIRVGDTETRVIVHAQNTKIHIVSNLGSTAKSYLNDIGDNLSR